MKKFNLIAGVAFSLLFSLFQVAMAQQMVGIEKELTEFVGAQNITVHHLIACRASDIAMRGLDFDRSDPNVLALTDAGYAIVSGETTEKCIDGITVSTGCTVGKSNLLIIQRSYWKPLWFAFFRKDTEEGIYLEVKGTAFAGKLDEFSAISDDGVFATIEKANISAKRVPDFGGNGFSIATISMIWAKGAPYDFLKAAEFHNHLCPGVTSGFMISKYLEKNLPIQNGSQSYSVIACPPWCKDDGLQVFLDCTVGKKGMAVKHLTEEQAKKLPKGIAGIFIRRDNETKSGRGLVLTFDWDKVNQVCGKAFKPEMTLIMMEYTDKPEIFISAVKEFDISADGIDRLKCAGVNPYIELGMMSKNPK